MLGDKDRVSSHRGLAAIVGRLSRSEACINKVVSVAQYLSHALALQVAPLGVAEAKAASEPRAL